MIQPGAESVGGDLADEAFQVGLAGMERTGETVEGDSLDGGSECRHRCAAFIDLVSRSSIRRTP